MEYTTFYNFTQIVYCNTLTMTKISNVIREFMDEKNMTISYLSEWCDIPKDTVKSILYGKVQDVKVSTMIKLADSFDCSLDELIGRSTSTDNEKNLYKSLQTLPKRSITLVEEIINLEKYIAEENQKNQKDKIPVLIPTKYMCDNMYFDSFNYETINISYLPNNKTIICGLKLTSNEYSPTYNKDDILLLAKDRPPVENEYAIFLNEGLTYLRKLRNNKFIPENNIEKPIPFTDELHIIGYVFTIHRTLK